jgi:hypothetical protein
MLCALYLHIFHFLLFGVRREMQPVALWRKMVEDSKSIEPGLHLPVTLSQILGAFRMYSDSLGHGSMADMFAGSPGQH